MLAIGPAVTDRRSFNIVTDHRRRARRCRPRQLGNIADKRDRQPAGRVHVGGNLGGSLLGELDQIGRDDWVVLELSSFMLQDMADAGDRYGWRWAGAMRQAAASNVSWKFQGRSSSSRLLI